MNLKYTYAAELWSIILSCIQQLAYLTQNLLDLFLAEINTKTV